MKPKLTLRDLFWLVLVVAMGCGWWLDSKQKALRFAELVRAIDQEGYSVHEYSGELVINKYVTVESK